MNFNNIFIDGYIPSSILTETEFIKYLKMANEGNIEARNKIILHNIKLVFYRISKRFYNVPYDNKELVSIGIEGLMKSVDSYDLEKNTSFNTYAIKCIDNEILMFLRKLKREEKVISLDGPLTKEGNIKLKDAIIDNKDYIQNYIDSEEKKDLCLKILEIVNRQSKRDIKIFELYFGLNGNTPHLQKEIAKMYNLTQSYISRIIIRIIKEIKLSLTEYNINSDKDNIKKLKNT